MEQTEIDRKIFLMKLRQCGMTACTDAFVRAYLHKPQNNDGKPGTSETSVVKV